MDTFDSIRKAKRKAAELADTTLSLVNSKEIDTASSYYLKALEVGKIKIQAKLGNEIGTLVENARNSRIQATLDHLGREHVVSCVV